MKRLVVDGDTIPPRSSVSEDPREANYKLEDLTPEFVIEVLGAALRFIFVMDN